MGPGENRPRSFPSFALGIVLIAIAVIATGAALGSVFDPRWQDLPYAALTMAAVPLASLSWLNRPKAGARPIAETVFRGNFLFSALYIVFIEGIQNWQAVWTSGAYVLLGLSMYGSAAKKRSLSPNLRAPEQSRAGIRNAGSNPNSRFAFADDTAPPSSAIL